MSSGYSSSHCAQQAAALAVDAAGRRPPRAAPLRGAAPLQHRRRGCWHTEKAAIPSSPLSRRIGGCFAPDDGLQAMLLWPAPRWRRLRTAQPARTRIRGPWYTLWQPKHPTSGAWGPCRRPGQHPALRDPQHIPAQAGPRTVAVAPAAQCWRSRAYQAMRRRAPQGRRRSGSWCCPWGCRRSTWRNSCSKCMPFCGLAAVGTQVRCRQPPTCAVAPRGGAPSTRRRGRAKQKNRNGRPPQKRSTNPLEGEAGDQSVAELLTSSEAAGASE